MVWRLGRWVACFIVLLLFAHPIAAPAQITAALTHWQSSQWWRNTATLDLDFINDRYWLNGTQYSGVSSFITGSGATFTRAGTTVTASGAPFYLANNQTFSSRAGTATYFDSTGTLHTAAANVARTNAYYYNGTNWVLGGSGNALIESTSTNYVTNSTMTGAVGATTITPQSISNMTASGSTVTVTTGTAHGLSVGSVVVVSGASPSQYNGTFSVASTPTTTTFTYAAYSTPASSPALPLGSYTAQTQGTAPTSWGFAGGSSGGFNYQIANTGVEYGMNFVDYRFFGNFNAFFELIPGGGFTTASAGQNWSGSFYGRIVAGSVGGGRVYAAIQTSGGNSSCSANNGGVIQTSTLQQLYFNCTMLSGVTSGRLDAAFQNFTSGQYYDFTVRFYAPQYENAAYITSFIPTSGSSASRSADVYVTPAGGTYFDATGTMQTAAANVPRLDHSPTSPYAAEGILIEESRTNSDLNSTFSGAVAGSPGSVPNWNGFGTSSGITIAITGSGTEFGMPYLEVNFSGTNSTASTIFPGFNPSSNTATSASVAWAASSYVRLVSGTLPGSFQQYIFEYNSSQTFLTGTAASLSSLTTTPQKIVTIDTVGSSTAYVLQVFKVTFPANATGNVTIRVYAPQLELGAFPTSYIPTSGSAVTRAADVFTVPTTAAGANGAWYTAGVGTLGTVGVLPYVSTSNSKAFVSITDGTSNNYIQEHIYPSGGLYYDKAVIGISGSGAYAYTSAATYNAGATTKIAMAYQTNNVNAASDGVLGTLATSVAIPTVSQMNVGTDRLGASLNGWINRIWYFPTQQPNYSLPDYTR